MERQSLLSAGEDNTGAHTSYRFDERSYLNLIKKEVSQKAKEIGFSLECIGKLDILISELTSNLLKFGERKQEFLWKPINQHGKYGIEMLAIDKGPGIAHVHQAVQDGYSTSGTAGEGLGAVKRLSDFFDIYSQPKAGTVVLCRCFEKGSSRTKHGAFTVGAVSVAKIGENVCGDGYQVAYYPAKKQFCLLILDGLGHGPDAHYAAQQALRKYNGSTETKPGPILEQIHEAIQKTRGAVGMAVIFDMEREKLLYSGVGNISGKLTAFEKPVSLVSSNGILGYKIPQIREHEADWGRGQLLILHSDGIPARWDLSAYPQIEKHDPSLLAACLYRDFDRGSDDVTILVSKYPRGNESGK
jgi:anti-sigma regulatory factor (Ser/Thr protein kinase)